MKSCDFTPRRIQDTPTSQGAYYRLSPRQSYVSYVKEIIPTRIGEIIVGDITYIPMENVDGQRRFCYVSLLMDSHSKMILGSSVGMTLEAKYPMEALTLAIKHLTAYGVELSATIHHSDRGVQYTCSDYVTELRKNKMMISMAESGNPKDNAEAERINNTLKKSSSFFVFRVSILLYQFLSIQNY